MVTAQVIKSSARALHLRRSSIKDAEPLFSTSHYLSELEHPPEFVGPLMHYLSIGWRGGLSPHPLVDSHWYWRGSTVRLEPILHYVASGSKQDRSPHPLFDPKHYRAQLAEMGIPLTGTPLGHYLTIGHRLGFDPHPLVSNAWYLDKYPDVARVGMEPLTHFVAHGWNEGRILSGWLDARYVREEYELEGQGIATILRSVVTRLVPQRLPTRDGQSPLLDIRDSRAAMAKGSRRPFTTPRQPSQHLGVPPRA